MDKIVGMMWNRNEGDILEEVILEAIKHVDSLFIADDNSTDNSWEIVQRLAKDHKDKIEYIRNKREIPEDQGQRTTLLNEIRRRYKPESTWVQVIESDVMIVGTDIRQALAEFAIEDMAMSWQALNAVRKPGTWKEVDTYPNWTAPIKELMPYQHRMEIMLYTFRPLPALYYDFLKWRPWPSGFSKYTTNPVKVFKKGNPRAPILGHFGYRGPTHLYKKFNPKGLPVCKSRNGVWDFSTVETIEKTLPFFNGGWNYKDKKMPWGRINDSKVNNT